MKNIKKILAAALVLVMVLCFTACHKKDEIAVRVGDVEFTSAYYMCALISADSEARAEVEENLKEGESTDDIDYFSKKIDGKKYVDWVEDRAIEKLKEAAAYKTLCKENKLELTEEQIADTTEYVSLYWNNYGYVSLFEPNGVSQNTFLQFNLDSLYSSLYFDFLYGAEGEKAISEDLLKQKLVENFVNANVLTVYFSEETDEEMAQIKSKFEGYEAALKSKKMTFEEVYHDYYANEHDNSQQETEESAPQDSHATILGSSDSSYSFVFYEEAKEMAIGEVKLFEQENSAGYFLVVKKDISKDPYYLETLDNDLRHIVADEEFKADMKEYYTPLKAEIEKSAIKPFKVKKIKYPES